MILITGSRLECPRLEYLKVIVIIMHKMVTEMGNGSQLPMLAIKKGV